MQKGIPIQVTVLWLTRLPERSGFWVLMKSVTHVTCEIPGELQIGVCKQLSDGQVHWAVFVGQISHLAVQGVPGRAASALKKWETGANFMFFFSHNPFLSHLIIGVKWISSSSGILRGGVKLSIVAVRTSRSNRCTRPLSILATGQKVTLVWFQGMNFTTLASHPGGTPALCPVLPTKGSRIGSRKMDGLNQTHLRRAVCAVFASK